ncbi:MAG: peptidylprolyl isomerase [Myxococcota bacterium]
MPNPRARFLTSLGPFEAEIYVEQMPITGGNFVRLAERGFYDGLHFHRVVDGFMVLFGCPFTRDPADPRAGRGGPPEGNIPDEFLDSARLSNEAGTLSMANANRPDTGGSQFFVNLADNPFLDWFRPGPSAHPVFGRVTAGMDVVRRIGAAPTDLANRPVPPVRVDRVAILR